MEKDFLREPHHFVYIAESDCTLALPAAFFEDYFFLRNALNVLSAGIDLGRQKGNNWTPAHALALSNALNENAFPVWEMNKEEAIRYLRKETLPPPPAHLPRGYLLVKFRGHALGFAKNIGTRANNLYPAAYRIRKAMD
jgi:NOL1/NOP2/fmu family ribosome biogenesis protein